MEGVDHLVVMDLATATLETGKAILTKQQKFIRIADREENGWEVVKHYVSDELASDSDDEKAICKARREALTSITKRKAKRREQFRNAPLYTSHTAQRDGAGRRNWGDRAYAGDRTPFDRRKLPTCCACGKEGHL